MTSKPENNSINYVEFPATDLAAIKEFYGAAFGWSFVDYGPSYIAIQGATLDGGFTTDSKPSTEHGNGVLPVLYHSDLENCLEAVKQAGGGIEKEIYSFPGGRRFEFTDPSGNHVAVWSE